jgi:hypothetical protein
MTQQDKIIERVDILEQLVESQSKTLEIDNQIISMKNRMLELSQQETMIYKREVHILRILCALGFVIILTLLVSEILSLR